MRLRMWTNKVNKSKLVVCLQVRTPSDLKNRQQRCSLRRFTLSKKYSTNELYVNYLFLRCI